MTNIVRLFKIRVWVIFLYKVYNFITNLFLARVSLFNYSLNSSPNKYAQQSFDLSPTCTSFSIFTLIENK